MKKNKKILFIRIALLVGTVISLFFVPWILVKAFILPLPQTVDGQLKQATKQGFEGVVAYVDIAGNTPQYFAAGWHNKEQKIEAKANALFKIASISKLYDAVAVTKMANSGLLSLDKTITDYLPELSGKIENANRITLRQMIQHRSGIPNFTDAPNFWSAPTQTFEESLALIEGMPANFAPREDYEYCNTNYLLLNRIMDDKLGYHNFRFIQNEILTPLKLENTYSALSEVNMDHVMSGYHVGHPHDLKEDEHGMLATAEDVGTFIRALNNGSVFKDGEKEIYAELYEFEHSGWVPGYQSFAEYDKELDAVIVVFYSTTDAKLLYWNLSQIINNRIIKILKRQQKP